MLERFRVIIAGIQNQCSYIKKGGLENLIKCAGTAIQ